MPKTETEIPITHPAQVAHQSSQVVGTTSNPTRTVNTYDDLDEMSITLTTGANPVLVIFSGTFTHDTSGESTYVIVDIDGTDKTESAREWIRGTTSTRSVLATSWLSTVTAASHTWKIQWKTTIGTATAFTINRTMQVIELKLN